MLVDAGRGGAGTGARAALARTARHVMLLASSLLALLLTAPRVLAQDGTGGARVSADGSSQGGVAPAATATPSTPSAEVTASAMPSATADASASASAPATEASSAAPPVPASSGSSASAAPTARASDSAGAAGATPEPPAGDHGGGHGAGAEAEESPFVAVKTILGLFALLALAYLGGHPRIRALERRVGVSQVITAGFPFLALGLLASLPSVEILTPSTIQRIEPLLHFGLGWLGFILGFRLDVRLLGMPRAVAAVVAVRTGICLAAIGGGAALVFFTLGGFRIASFSDPLFLRDALILGAAGVVTGQSAPALVRQIGGDAAAEARVRSIVKAEELAAMVGLVFLGAYFRPPDGWQLPATGWLLLTVGLGAVSGLLVYAIMLVDTTARAEYVVLAVGAVDFAAGIAGKLDLSPLVVCFVAGILVQNFPGPYKERLTGTLRTLERPTYLAFLLVVGALWRPRDWHGWLLAAVFIVTRLAGKFLGTTVTRARTLGIGHAERSVLVVSPMGAVAIAIGRHRRRRWGRGERDPRAARHATALRPADARRGGADARDEHAAGAPFRARVGGARGEPGRHAARRERHAGEPGRRDRHAGGHGPRRRAGSPGPAARQGPRGGVTCRS